MRLDTGYKPSLKYPLMGGSKSVESTLNKVNTIDEFCSQLFSIRDTLHLHHLKQNGLGAYAGHKHLQELYNIVLDICDSLVESASTDKLLDLDIPKSCITNDCLDYVIEVLEWVRRNRAVFPYSFQQGNLLDPLEQALSSTIYKLRFLK